MTVLHKLKFMNPIPMSNQEEGPLNKCVCVCVGGGYVGARTCMPVPMPMCTLSEHTHPFMYVRTVTKSVLHL